MIGVSLRSGRALLGAISLLLALPVAAEDGSAHLSCDVQVVEDEFRVCLANKALGLLEKTSRDDVKNVVFGNVSTLYRNLGRWNDAYEIAEKVPDLNVRFSLYAISAAAETLYSKSEELYLWPRAVMSAQAVKDQFERIQALASLARVVVINCCSELAIEATELIDPGYYQGFVAADAASRMLERDDVQGVEAMFARIPKNKHSMELAALLARAIVRNGKLEEAEKLLEECGKHGICPGLERGIAVGLAESGDAEAALARYNDKWASDQKTYFETQMPVALANGGNAEQAVEQAAKIQSQSSRSFAIDRLNPILAGAGLFDAAMQAAETLDSANVRLAAKARLGQTLLAAGQRQAALDLKNTLIEQLSEQSKESDVSSMVEAYGEIAVLCARLHDFEATRELISELRSVYESSAMLTYARKQHDLVALEAIWNEWADAGEHDAVLADAEHLNSNRIPRGRAVRVVARDYFEKSKKTESLAAVASLEDQDWQAIIYSELSRIGFDDFSTRAPGSPGAPDEVPADSSRYGEAPILAAGDDSP